MTLDNKVALLIHFSFQLMSTINDILKCSQTRNNGEGIFLRNLLLQDDFNFTRYKIDLPLKHKYWGNLSPQNINKRLK